MMKSALACPSGPDANASFFTLTFLKPVFSLVATRAAPAGQPGSIKLSFPDPAIDFEPGARYSGLRLR